MASVFKCCDEKSQMVEVSPDEIAPADGWVSYSDFLDMKLLALELIALYDDANTDYLSEVSNTAAIEEFKKVVGQYIKKIGDI